MFGSNKQLATMKQERDHLKALNSVLSAMVDASQRSHRKPDLDRPVHLELRPLAAFKDHAIKTGLQRIFDHNWFDICAFEKLAKIARIYVPPELDEHLHAIHCVHWNKMDPEYRDQIQQHIIAAFCPVESPVNASND